MRNPLLDEHSFFQSPVSAGRRLQKRHLAPALLPLALLAHATANACTTLDNPGTAIHLTINAWEDPTPDRLIAAWHWGGSALFLSGCAIDSDVPISVVSTLAPLEFVRNVTLDGETYPAFGLIAYPNSPLLVFRHWAGNLGTGEMMTPLDVRNTVAARTAAFSGGRRTSHVQIAAVSRGGTMESIPLTSLGAIARTSPAFSMFTKTDTFSVTATLTPPTCTVTDKVVPLQDIDAADLPAAGASTGEVEFNVRMNCSGTFPVALTLTDANAPGNTGSRLEPSSNATADGVRVELLRQGAPVVLGQAWVVPAARNGAQDIPLAARYYREAGEFSAGVVEGQAIITATYR